MDDPLKCRSEVFALVMHCPSCGAENPDHSEYCNLCLVSFGFGEDPEYTRSERQNEGFLSEYPSIFKQPLPPIEPGSDMKAEPVDIGSYGVRTGENVNSSQAEVPCAPVDVGRYGGQSGADPGLEHDSAYSSPGDPNAKKEDKKKRHLFRRER
jgi:hypothetical protein